MSTIRHMAHRLLDRQESWTILLVFGLVLRVIALLLAWNEPLVGDSLHYAGVAKQYLAGNFQDTYWPPGLPLYEAAWMTLFGETDWALRTCMLPWFVMLMRGVYILFQRVHSRPAANLAVLFLCIYPELVHHSIEPLTHLPTAACLVWVLNQAVMFGKEGRMRIVLTGAVMAYLVLLRPSSALLLLALPAWLIFQRRLIFKPALMTLVAAALVGGWVFFLSGYHGRNIWINESNARNFYLGNNTWTPTYKTWYLGSHWEGEPEIDEGFRQSLGHIQSLPHQDQPKAFADAAISHIQAEPGMFMVRTASRIRTLFVFDTFTGGRLASHYGQRFLSYGVLLIDALLFTLILGFGASMLVGVWRREIPGVHLRLFTFTILLYGLPYFLAFSHPTYHLAFLPILAGLAAVPISNRILPGSAVRELSPRKKFRLVWVWLLVAALQIEWIYHMMP